MCLETGFLFFPSPSPTQPHFLTLLGWHCNSEEWNVLFGSRLRQAWGLLGLWRYENPAGREKGGGSLYLGRDFRREGDFELRLALEDWDELRPGTVILSGSFSET